MCEGEGERLRPMGKGRKVRELAGTGAVVEGGESGGLSKNGRRQNSDSGIVIVTRIQVGASREGVSFVRLARDMD
jgi:hypothetical protein